MYMYIYRTVMYEFMYIKDEMLFEVIIIVRS